MIEILKAVAMLCAVQTGGNNFYKHIADYQKECQQKLVTCVLARSEDNRSDETKLATCLAPNAEYYSCPNGGCGPRDLPKKYRGGKLIKN